MLKGLEGGDETGGPWIRKSPNMGIYQGGLFVSPAYLSGTLFKTDPRFSLQIINSPKVNNSAGRMCVGLLLRVFWNWAHRLILPKNRLYPNLSIIKSLERCFVIGFK